MTKNKSFLRHRNIYIGKKFPESMEKRGQLGIIEFKFFIMGLAIGIVAGLILVFLSTKGVIPNVLGFLCQTAVK